jgi:FAD/FMN-containing dehydrogenase
LGGKVHYQTLPADPFKDYISAQQSDIRPLCLILPTSVQDVSDAIKIIAQHECIFAVKSGGHAMFSGASNAENGITFDLRYLNELGISEDHATAYVGTGNRWNGVYDFLDQWNLTVVGGRDSQV